MAGIISIIVNKITQYYYINFIVLFLNDQEDFA